MNSDGESLDYLEKYTDDILKLDDYGNPFRTVVSNLSSRFGRQKWSGPTLGGFGYISTVNGLNRPQNR